MFEYSRPILGKYSDVRASKKKRKTMELEILIAVKAKSKIFTNFISNLPEAKMFPGITSSIWSFH